MQPVAVRGQSRRLQSSCAGRREEETRKRPRKPEKMASGLDQVAGMSLVFFSLLLFTYYSVWVIVLPFVDSDYVLHRFFLPREYSVVLPGVAAVVLLLCTGTFAAVVVWKNHRPKKGT